MPASDISGEHRRLLERLIPIAREAGRVILEVYAGDFAVRGKGDDSPVTEADERAEAVIAQALTALTPGVPVVAEESVAADGLPEFGTRFWLVDPLDGTREFISRNGEFTVNIALVENGLPSAGVVFAPALDRLFAGAIGCGAFAEEGGLRRTIEARHPPAEGLTVVSSRSHDSPHALADCLQGRPVAARMSVGSSLKLCLIAAGEADFYPRAGRTMEWDIAAGHAVLAAAGGKVLTMTGDPLRYGKAGLANPPFIASGLPD